MNTMGMIADDVKTATQTVEITTRKADRSFEAELLRQFVRG